MRHTRLAFLAVAISTTLLAQTPAPADFDALVKRLEPAAMNGDAVVVKDVRLALLRALASPMPPEKTAMFRYTVAYAGWRLAFVPALSPSEQADLLNDAEVQLNAAIKIKSNFADAIGLLSSVLGIKIAKTPDLGMTLGPRSSQLLAEALVLEPANPRLLTVRGASLQNTPPEFGGDAKLAEGAYRQALTLFDAEPATKAWPSWGRFDAHAGLGQVLAARGDKAGARAEYTKALAIAPASGYVLYVLMPAVK